MRLDLAIADIAAIAHRLFAEHPELAEDEVLRADTLEGCSDLGEVFSLIAQRIREAKADANAQDALIELYRERKANFERREQMLRALAMRLMNVADIAKWQAPQGTFSMVAGKPKADVYDDRALPLDFCKTTITPDKAAIKAALERGEEVPGARLSNGAPSLRFA